MEHLVFRHFLLLQTTLNCAFSIIVQTQLDFAADYCW